MDYNLTDDEDFLELVEYISHHRAQQIFRERPNHFEKWNDEEFKARFRLSKNVVKYVIDEIGGTISHKTKRSRALTPEDMVLITLRFLATGCFLQVVGDFSGVDKSIACRTVDRVTQAIATLSHRFIRMPHTTEEIHTVRQGFYNISRFPRCIGALDCTHIKIISPGGENAEAFRWPGSTHDAHIFRSSNVRYEFEQGAYGDSLLVGDSGYGIKPYLMTPLANVQTPAENLFNESQIRTRKPIERCFGVLKRRFPILADGIRNKWQKVEAIAVSCAVLHNIACTMKDAYLSVNEEVEEAINVVFPVDNVVNRDFEPNNVARNVLINDYFENLLNVNNGN